MLSHVQKALDEYIEIVPLNTSDHHNYRCKAYRSYNRHVQECQTFYFGSLIQALNTRGYYPLPTPTTYKGTLSKCRLHLIKCLSKIQPPSANFYGHDKCSPQHWIKSDLLAITPDVSLTEAQEKHLSQQALRSGLAVQDEIKGHFIYQSK